MSDRILITLDLSKINKDKIVPRSYTNRNNEVVTSKDYKIEVIPLKDPQVIKQGPDWKMIKTHFVVESQSKEEKSAKAKSVTVGSGIVFKSNADADYEAF